MNGSGGGALNASAAAPKDIPGSSTSNSSKDVIVTEPIMATPPPAKDFLTYVCFQRNPVFQSLSYLGKSSTAANNNNAAVNASTSSAAMTSPVKSPSKRMSRGEDSSEEEGAKPRSGRKTKHVEAKMFPPMGAPLKVPEESQTVAKKPSSSSAVQEKPVKRKPGRPPKVADTTKSESEYETASENESEDKKRIKGDLRESTGISSSANSAKEWSSKGAAVVAVAASPLREEVSSPVASEPKEERITRHMAWRYSYNNTPIEPTVKRKPKVVQEVDVPVEKEEKAPLPPPPPPPLQKKANKEVEVDSEFSSDDDKPLMMSKPSPATEKKTVQQSSGNKKSLVKAGAAAAGSAEKTKKKAGAAALTKRKSSPVATSSVLSTPPKKISKAAAAAATTSTSQSTSDQRNNKKKKSDQESDTEAEGRETLTGSESKTKRKYLSKELEKLTADISHTPTDFSENETKTAARPTRKTKEAATIYMELIGHKLNLHDTDEEGASSMDSYPELPNVKKTQQLEEECRQNVKEQKVERRGRKKKVVPPPEEDVAVQVTEDENKLDKSFSDSDEEPLATKLTKKPKRVSAVGSPVKSPPVAAKPSEVNVERKKVEPPKRSPVKLADAEDVLNFSMTTFKSPISNENYSMVISTPENSKSAINRTPQAPPLHVTKSGWSPVAVNEAPSRLSPVEFLRPPNKAKPKTCEGPISPIVDDTSPQNIASLMMNPLPSKEESGKIFGIASVTLAQSSGPQDTKCTLGKCGSIHNPSLGPAVPTEALLGETSSTKERRKSKVNMSQEQIQKWLIDCAAVGEKDIQPDDLADLDYSVTPQPNTAIVDSPMEEGSPSIHNRKSEAPQPPLAKPSLVQPLQPLVLPAHQPITKARNLIEKFEEDKDAETSEVEQSVKQIIQKLNFDEDLSVLPLKVTSPTTTSKDQQKTGKEKASGGTKNKPQQMNSSAEPTTPTSVDRKPIYNRRTPVYNKAATVDEVPQPAKTLTKQNSFGAFSPENEHSVYAFDREEDDVSPMKPPFRRKSNTESPRTGRGRKSSSSPQKPVTSENSPQVSVSLNASSSVALQMSLPSPSFNEDSKTLSGGSGRKKGGQPQSPAKKKQKNSEATVTVDGNDSDSEGQTIYIPLQNAGVNKSGKNDQMIQGVSVKLGTEGPDGCVIMKAKLVTKSVTAVGGSTMTDAKTQELMKSIIAGKDVASGSKAVPVGTVQPRFKSNETAGGSLLRCGSNSSLVSQKSTATNSQRRTDTTPIQASNNTAFPRLDDPPQIVDAPVFRPTEKEFQDPIAFIERIMPIAARFGLCRIIPPSSFKPECRVSDDMRFMAYNQYVHKMQNRWGSSVKEMCAIRKYLATQSIQMNQPPLIGGMEVDLPRLYHTVQELGGLKEVIEKKKWARVAEEMCIPKAAQDRVSKLDDIYCKFLLPYDTLSPAERQKLFDEVQADWVKREAKARRSATRKIESDDGDDENANDSEEESSEDEEEEEGDDNLMECIVKGRSMALNAFFRVARNTMWLWFKNNDPPPPVEVEHQFWRHVGVRDSHVCVHSGSIDSSGWGYGFPAPGGNKSKGSPCAKHPWNLKVLTNNSGSVLRSLGPVMGVTVPTLHVGMVFSACCWYRDPHGLPWIEYLHTGGSKIWYGVPDEQSTNFRTVLTGLVPTLCQNKTIWLPCDTAMVPPQLLIQRGVSLCRTEQKAGEFVIIFPRAYTSSLATGYVVSESVYFATNQWLDTAHEDFEVREKGKRGI